MTNRIFLFFHSHLLSARSSICLLPLFLPHASDKLPRVGANFCFSSRSPIFFCHPTRQMKRNAFSRRTREWEREISNYLCPDKKVLDTEMFFVIITRGFWEMMDDEQQKSSRLIHCADEWERREKSFLCCSSVIAKVLVPHSCSSEIRLMSQNCQKKSFSLDERDAKHFRFVSFNLLIRYSGHA